MLMWTCVNPEQMLIGSPEQDYDHYNLEVGYEDGSDRVLLWLPTICKHVITEDSPLASWLKTFRHHGRRRRQHRRCGAVSAHLKIGFERVLSACLTPEICCAWLQFWIGPAIFSPHWCQNAVEVPSAFTCSALSGPGHS